MQRGSFIIRPVTVSIRIGRPIDTAGRTVNDRDRIVSEAREAIAALLGQGPVLWKS
jgi:hypothetical protein